MKPAIPGKAIRIRSVEPDDMAQLYALLRESGDSQAIVTPVECTEDELHDILFATPKTIHCEMIEVDDRKVGFVFWAYSFSPFKGRRILQICDFFIQSDLRSHGLGRAALGHLARRCIAEGLAGIDGFVVSWDEGAVAFQRAVGAKLLDDWLICQLEAEQLWRLAHEQRDEM